jgi:hypothetical protein
MVVVDAMPRVLYYSPVFPALAFPIFSRARHIVKCLLNISAYNLLNNGYRLTQDLKYVESL